MNAKCWFILVSLTALSACSPRPRAATVVPAATVVVRETVAAFATAVVEALQATPAPLPTAAPGEDSAPGSASQLSFAPASSGLVIKDGECKAYCSLSEYQHQTANG